MDNVDEEIEKMMYKPSIEEIKEGREALKVLLKIFLILIGTVLSVDFVVIVLHFMGVLWGNKNETHKIFKNKKEQ